MTTENVYQPSSVDLTTIDDEEFADINIFTTRGRIGRIRYIGYSLIAGIVMMLISIPVGFLGAITGEAVSTIMMGLLNLAYVGILVLLTIQRLHDFNLSGWWLLLFIWPLINLLLWFIPGSRDENDYDLPPPPNSGILVFFAVILPIAWIGIVAAIAIPAYQGYVERASQAQIGHR